MNDAFSSVLVALAALLSFAILVGGFVTCSVITEQERTKRVETACTGNLAADSARAAACAVALSKRDHF